MKRPYDLAPDERADHSVRKILVGLNRTLQSHVAGVVEDTDVECLHDLRVANRRTRTFLSQIKGVLPPSEVDRFSPEFKWLGVVTGPCRDLDVALVEVDTSRYKVDIDENTLSPLHEWLEELRRVEHEKVSAALQSARFRLLVQGWEEFLASQSGDDSEAPLASAPIIEVAEPRILKAAKRIRKRGPRVGVDAPAALLHRLRIDGKKLRYLLEFFSVLYPLRMVSRFIDELKLLQDILGGFNDAQVQLALIREFEDHGAPPNPTLAATNRLVDAITEREHELRAEFVDRFEKFADDQNRRAYKKTFKVR